MSTTALPLVRTRSHVVADRRFYLAMAIAGACLIFTGFARSYYLKSHFPLSPKLSFLVHVHGAVFTAWILYFILQTALIAVRKPALHRRLGYTGALLGSAVIVLGLLVSFTAMRLNHGTSFIPPATVFLVGLVDMLTFGLFFILGWVRRRDREAHQRLMLLAVIAGLLGAPMGRIVGYGVPIPVVSIINFAFLFAGPIYDLVTRRRIHPVYIYGCLFALVTFTPLRFAVGATPQWQRIAHVFAHS